MDFTLKMYKQLLTAFLSNGYVFFTVRSYMANESPYLGRLIMLRHDVESRYENAMKMAEIQAEMGVKGTYYFRINHSDKNDRIIRRIAAMGHEIGYHYDDLSHCKGDTDAALKRFTEHLKHLRQFGQVSSICMEGAPLSGFDNRDLWKNKVSYRNFGITTEPYFDLDFDRLFYLTDTARCWNGWKYSRRDKMHQQKRWISSGWVYPHSLAIIQSLQNDIFPEQLMMTFHPQRWTGQPFHWAEELVLQNIKNLIKRLLFTTTA